MATREMMGDAIAPGSTEYGQRGALASNFPSGAPDQAGPTGGTMSPSPSPGFNFDPLDALENGIEPPRGQGRLQVQPPTGQTTRQQRLTAIAREANNPALRHIARQLLVRETRSR